MGKDPRQNQIQLLLAPSSPRSQEIHVDHSQRNTGGSLKVPSYWLITAGTLHAATRRQSKDTSNIAIMILHVSRLNAVMIVRGGEERGVRYQPHKTRYWFHVFKSSLPIELDCSMRSNEQCLSYGVAIGFRSRGNSGYIRSSNINRTSSI